VLPSVCALQSVNHFKMSDVFIKTGQNGACFRFDYCLVWHLRMASIESQRVSTTNSTSPSILRRSKTLHDVPEWR
jgi:hypothetical protein